MFLPTASEAPMIVLYGTQGSGAAAVEAALEVAGVPYRNVDAASWKPGPGLDELRGVNPLAEIPTVVLPDGSVLTESAAILILLGQRYADSGLLPQAIEKRAQAIRGLVYIAANCYSAIGIIDFPARYSTDTDEPLRERIRAGTSIWRNRGPRFMRLYPRSRRIPSSHLCSRAIGPHNPDR